MPLPPSTTSPRDPDRVMWIGIRRGLLLIAGNVHSEGIRRGLLLMAKAIEVRYNIGHSED